MALVYVGETPNCDIAKLMTSLNLASATYMYRSQVPWLEFKDGNKRYLVNKQNTFRNKSWNEFNSIGIVDGIYGVYENKYYKFRMLKHSPSENIDEYTPFYNLSNKNLVNGESWWLNGSVDDNRGNAYYRNSSGSLYNITKTSTGYYTRLLAEQFCSVYIRTTTDDLGDFYRTFNGTLEAVNRVSGVFEISYALNGVEYARELNHSSGAKTFGTGVFFDDLSFGRHVLTVTVKDVDGLTYSKDLYFNKVNEPISSLPPDATLSDVSKCIDDLFIDLECKKIILKENIESTGVNVDANSSLNDLIKKVVDCGAVFS